MRIDSHQHFWKYNPERHAWITKEMEVIRKNFLPDDLIPILKEHAMDGSVVVQAEESFRETAFLLDLANEHSEIKAVVGWADLANDELDKDLDQFSNQSKLKGYREILQDKKVDYMLRKEFLRGIRKLGARGYTYDILIFHQQLKAAHQLIKSCPEQLFVIDHIAKPNIKLGIWKDWKKELALLAEREYIYCKLSGMLTEADWKNWKPADLQIYLEESLELFGPNRLMFGSDWPVCKLAAEYDQVLDLIEQFTDSLSSTEKSAIMGQTAMEFYSIPEESNPKK